MSAIGGKADSLVHLSECLLIAKSGHAGFTLVLEFNTPRRADPAFAIHGLRPDQPFPKTVTFTGWFASRPAECVIREVAPITGGRPAGIVTLIKYGPILILLGEAKSLKMHMATNGNLPRFRSKTD